MDASMIFLQHLQVSTQVSTQTAPAFLSRCCKQRTVTRRTSCGPPTWGIHGPMSHPKTQKEQKHHDVCNRSCDFFLIFLGVLLYNTIYLLGFMWFHHSISGGPPMSILLFLSSSHIWRIQMWSACGMLTSFRSRRKRSPFRWVHHYFQMGGIENLTSPRPSKARENSMSCWPLKNGWRLEAPSFLITSLDPIQHA